MTCPERKLTKPPLVLGKRASQQQQDTSKRNGDGEMTNLFCLYFKLFGGRGRGEMPLLADSKPSSVKFVYEVWGLEIQEAWYELKS